MPSDPRATRALEVLARPIERYRAALAATLEEVRGHLEAGRSDARGRANRLKEQLGKLGGVHIDPERLSSLLGEQDALDVTALQRLERASDTLRNLVSRGDGLFHIDVPPGADLAACIRRQLAAIGRAFSAARIAAASHSGAPSGLDETLALEAFPFAEWTAAERKLAPPLVVTVNGADLNAGALAPFVDGMQKILLLVDGLCAPAPLVRLITPGVLVVQAHEMNELEHFAGWPGAAVAALVPIWAVPFVHDPSAGPEPWQRLSMNLSREWKIKRIGGLTCAQQSEELKQLELLATAPAAAAAQSSAAPVVAAGDPADRLAAWLLQQANLTTLMAD